MEALYNVLCVHCELVPARLCKRMLFLQVTYYVSRGRDCLGSIELESRSHFVTADGNRKALRSRTSGACEASATPCDSWWLLLSMSSMK